MQQLQTLVTGTTNRIFSP